MSIRSPTNASRALSRPKQTPPQSDPHAYPSFRSGFDLLTSRLGEAPRVEPVRVAAGADGNADGKMSPFFSVAAHSGNFVL